MGERAPGHGEVARLVAPNPGPMTLAGTNTYLYGSDPCVAIDPGPDDSGHLEAVREAAEERGGIGLVLLTHSHGDHADGAGKLGAEVVLPGDGEEHGGLRALATPGHAPDHVCLLTADGVCFSGDLVLGEGSTFVPPDGGSLAAYMDSLRRVQAESIELICPGHGPWITDPAAKLAEYRKHRLWRESRVLEELTSTPRRVSDLVADVYRDVPPAMHGYAQRSLRAHLIKLVKDGRVFEDHDGGFALRRPG